jgi:hypothetical protein
MSKEINYKTVIDLGFKEIFEEDSVYENKYGFPYSIVSFNLTNKLYIDWDKTTRLCTLNRLRKNNIQKSYIIKDKEELITIINFFKE